MNLYAMSASICLRPSSLQQPWYKMALRHNFKWRLLAKGKLNNHCCDPYHHSAWKLYRFALLTAKGGTFITNHGSFLCLSSLSCARMRKSLCPCSNKYLRLIKLYCESTFFLSTCMNLLSQWILRLTDFFIPCFRHMVFKWPHRETKMICPHWLKKHCWAL